MPTAAEWDSTVDSIFEAFEDQQSAITHRRVRVGAFDPAADTYSKTNEDTALQALSPGSGSAFRRFLEANIADKGENWYVKGSELRSKEPLSTNDVLIVGSETREILSIRRFPESGGTVALFVLEVKKTEQTTDA